jgi:hypothetical protein
MAKSLGNVPFPPVKTHDASEPLTREILQDLFAEKPDGISLCVRRGTGHADRGGYFFHLQFQKDSNEYKLFDFEKNPVANLSLEQVVEFINHCTGLKFSEWAFNFCQSTVNFKLDPK